MTYQEFKNKYNEQYIDYDGAYGNQCWDLAQYYNVEVLNVPDSVLSGCGYVKNMILWDWKLAQLLEYFDEVDVHNMNQGDVCIWTGGYGGHIAIFDNWDGNNCWYFSQNPNPCRVMTVSGLGDPRAFRRKGNTPPTPEPTPVITPNVERDETRDQIEVLEGITDLRIRTTPGLNGEVIGHANPGFYNYLEVVDADGYMWYRISDNNWIAYSDEWERVYPKKEDEYVSFKVIEKEGNYKKIDLSDVYVKKD